MKLNIGENIRRLRRDADLTQEQLAEKLGVSYQSVSRWENGSTYPDMEFLPVLSSLFGVTVDELLGCDTAKHDEQLEKRINEYERMCDSPDTTPEDILPLIRELRRECLTMGRMGGHGYECILFDHMRCAKNQELKNHPAVIGELRITAEEIFSRPTPQWLHDAVVYAMAHLENEENIHAFLERHATKQDLSADSLLFSRYLHSGENDKLDPYRQKKLWLLVEEMVYGCLYKRSDRPAHVHESMHINDMVLNFIHNLCGVTPDPEHPITGDGSIDIFARARLLLGYRKSCYHATLGEYDKAWTALEDTVSMLEKVMSLPEGAMVSCKSICFEGAVMKIEVLDNNGDKMVRMMDRSVIHYGTVIEKYGALTPLTAPHGWEWFDSIRSDPRFDAYIQRVKVLFETPLNS